MKKTYFWITYQTYGNLVRGQNAGAQNAVQICIGGQNASWFLDRVDKMPVSSNHI